MHCAKCACGLREAEAIQASGLGAGTSAASDPGHLAHLVTSVNQVVTETGNGTDGA